jgi:hypothetical protein
MNCSHLGRTYEGETANFYLLRKLILTAESGTFLGADFIVHAKHLTGGPYLRRVRARILDSYESKRKTSLVDNILQPHSLALFFPNIVISD